MEVFHDPRKIFKRNKNENPSMSHFNNHSYNHHQVAHSAGFNTPTSATSAPGSSSLSSTSAKSFNFDFDNYNHQRHSTHHLSQSYYKSNDTLSPSSSSYSLNNQSSTQMTSSGDYFNSSNGSKMTPNYTDMNFHYLQKQLYLNNPSSHGHHHKNRPELEAAAAHAVAISSKLASNDINNSNSNNSDKKSISPSSSNLSPTSISGNMTFQPIAPNPYKLTSTGGSSANSSDSSISSPENNPHIKQHTPYHHPPSNPMSATNQTNQFYFNASHFAAKHKSADSSASFQSLEKQLNSFSNMMKRPKSTFPFGKCKVCHDKATGIHYGIATCEGCKGFFKRSTLRKEKYRCFFGNNCPLNPENRNRCKSCRFRKCLEVGMSIQGVKMGRIPKAEKEKALLIMKRNKTGELLDTTDNEVNEDAHANPHFSRSGELSNSSSCTDLSNSHENKYASNREHNDSDDNYNDDDVLSDCGDDGDDYSSSFNHKRSHQDVEDQDAHQASAHHHRHHQYSHANNYNLNISNYGESSQNLEKFMINSVNTGKKLSLTPPELVQHTSQSNAANAENLMPVEVHKHNHHNELSFNMTNLNLSNATDRLAAANCASDEKDCESNKNENTEIEEANNKNDDEDEADQAADDLSNHSNDQIKQAIDDNTKSAIPKNHVQYSFKNLTEAFFSKHSPKNSSDGEPKAKTSRESDDDEEASQMFTFFELLKMHKSFLNSSLAIHRYHSQSLAIRNHHQDYSYHIISSLISDKVYQVYVENNDRIVYLYERAMKLVSQNTKVFIGHDATMQEVWSSLLESIPSVVKNFISLAKDTPGLNELSSKDFTTIVNNRLFDYFMVKHAVLFINGESYLMLPNNIQYTKKWLLEIVGEKMTNAMFSFADEYNSLYLTTKEKALLIPFILTVPDYAFEDQTTIANLHEYYYRALLYEFDLNKRSNTFIAKWKKILSKMPELNELHMTQIGPLTPK